MKEVARPLNRAEVLLLKKCRANTEEALHKVFRIRALIGALVLGGLSAYAAWRIHGGFFSFILGTIAVVCFSFVAFAPFQFYKYHKLLKRQLADIDAFLAANLLKVVPVHALQIATAEEFEDEGDLFIVEYERDHVLFLWDNDFNLRKRFPCLQFEIYETSFARLINRQIYTASEKIRPVRIDRKNKWAYMQKIGAPENLTTERIRFDELVEQYNAVLINPGPNGEPNAYGV